MVDRIGATENFSSRILSEIQDMNREARNIAESNVDDSSKNTLSFADLLAENIDNVNDMQKIAGKMKTDLATGKSENIHETMIVASQAGLAFKLMVQMRNKGIEAYNEIMRMPV